MQRGGPHLKLFEDTLNTSQFPDGNGGYTSLSWKDVEIIWVEDITGPNGPAAKFTQDDSIMGCCVITPDMLGLTGGLQTIGDG